MARSKVFPSGSDYDDFNRSGAGSSPDLGSNYTDIQTAYGRTLIISSLYVGATAGWVASNDPTFVSYVDATGGTFSADQYADAEVLTVGASSGSAVHLGLMVRVSLDGGTSDWQGYFVVVKDGSDSTVSLRYGKKIPGDYSTFKDGGAKTVTWTSGDRLGIEVTGSSDPVIVITQNGSQIYTFTDDSGTRYTGGSPGLSASDTSTTNRRLIDNFQAGDITSGSTPRRVWLALNANQSIG